jgi:hypothetical protein
MKSLAIIFFEVDESILGDKALPRLLLVHTLFRDLFEVNGNKIIFSPSSIVNLTHTNWMLSIN